MIEIEDQDGETHYIRHDTIVEISPRSDKWAEAHGTKSMVITSQDTRINSVQSAFELKSLRDRRIIQAQGVSRLQAAGHVRQFLTKLSVYLSLETCERIVDLARGERPTEGEPHDE